MDVTPTSRRANAYYNLLVDGFAAGQLNLKVAVPPGSPPSPIPTTRRPTSLFANSFSSPGGCTTRATTRENPSLLRRHPAVLLFGPYRVLTGRYLDHAYAVAGVLLVGFLTAVGLLPSPRGAAIFPMAPTRLMLGGVLALGLANSVPVMLARRTCGGSHQLRARARVARARAVWWRAARTGAPGPLARGRQPRV